MTRALLLLSLVAGLLFGAPAQARRLPLDPENRVHLGAALTDNQTFGITGGLDSRLTRVVSVDVGGFVSPIPLPDDVAPVSERGQDFVFMRHGVYVAPGLRLPHRQPKALQWDLVLRPGFAALFNSDVHPDNQLSPNERFQTIATPSLFGGGELLLRKDHVGLRLSGRAYLFRQFSAFENADMVLVRPQYSAELVWQF
ncbi:hypothetical protein L6R53_01045 [Myxococcota bacterium]|nr:hypothetical protein [Myxococcota bacterium]